MASLRAALPLWSEAAARKLEDMAKSGGLDQAFGEFGAGSFLPPAATAALLGLALLCITVAILHKHSSKRRRNNLPPEVPGLPFVGNLLQMTVERPHRKLTSWSNEYGPIYTIRTGQKSQVIVSSPELAREAVVAKYSSISNRDLGSNLTILTRNRKIVAMSDYGDRYRMLKRMVVNNLLGQTSQKALHVQRENYLGIALDGLFDELGRFPGSTGQVNARDCIANFLFRLGTHQVFGRDIESVRVPELGAEVTRWEIYRILVQDVMKAAVQIDWRDFFPTLKWIPNWKFEDGIYKVERKRSAVTKALMEQHRQLSRSQQRDKCYCDVLLDNESHYSEDELLLAAWEPIIESSDTTLVTSEWALYELASAPKLQEKLYNEIKRVVGDERMVSEDDLPNLPFLNAVIKETLRKYSPVPILPPRYIHEQVELGGYTIPAGYQLIVNIFGIHHDPKRWSNPETWDPSRFLGVEGGSFDMGLTDMRLMPFGGGKRICAGMAQVFYVVPMIIATLVQHFEWTLPQGDMDKRNVVEDTVYLTTQKLEPLQACAKPRVPRRLPSKTLNAVPSNNKVPKHKH
ncbi:ent-kaurene oxidase 2 [Selaginella moellendorffii]|uniref:ent-kaurene oxidase 2 n=1 Tax=Selaginella moellendorffii TaxID=88036 RepID=UPI000D1C5731|nr:ent-kaurene oxidase 2 [Selaginella moellendorffii]|eukprot:XP_024527089.1 ent-kaurene oxidase 2 [Selaginella moellendorffii]